jgi:GR25 family glycosyltransferase involved in LPS biosynthesis
MKSAAFVISLERSQLRYKHAQSLLSQIPLASEILPAMDGTAMTVEQRAAVYDRSLHQPMYPFSLNPGEIGCFLSHRKAWQQISQRKLDAGLVLEDDVCIDDEQLSRSLELLRQECPGNAYVQLPVRPLGKIARSVAADSNSRIVRPEVTPLRTSGQWVTRQAAEQLLAATEKFDRPVDAMLQMFWVTGVHLMAIEPAGISDMTSDVGGSTISVRKSRGLKLTTISREFNRSLYRWRISRLSKSRAA